MNLYKQNRDVIFVRSVMLNAEPHIEEGAANGSVSPGDLVAIDLTSAKPVSAVATDNYTGPLVIADIDPFSELEQFRSGTRQVDAAYQDSDTVYYRRPLKGDLIQVRVTGAVSTGDKLTSLGATTAGQFNVNGAPAAGSVILIAQADAGAGELVVAMVEAN